MKAHRVILRPESQNVKSGVNSAAGMWTVSVSGGWPEGVLILFALSTIFEINQIHLV